MTVKEMFNKVAKFNKVAEELGLDEKKAIRYYNNHCSLVKGTFSNYQDFMKMVKEEYINEMVDVFKTKDFNLNASTDWEEVGLEGTRYEYRFEESHYFGIVDITDEIY